MADLITEFNYLGGTSISEHQANFSRYTKKLYALEEIARRQIVNNLKAAHRQEELYITKLLLLFDHKDKIKEIALSGDRILNKLIAYHKPFVFRDCDVNFFMNELFPNVSYIVRNKCINNLAATIDRDDVGEEFCKFILERYGIKSAMPLLIVCSQAFVREVVTHFRVMFKERHLITLHQRFGLEFCKFYYAEISKYGNSQHFSDQPFFARYLSTKDIPSFCYLLKYGLPRIGKIGFMNFVKGNKEELIKNPSKYATFIKIKILYRHLTKPEFKQYILNSLPLKVEVFDAYSVLGLLKLLPIAERGTVLAESFRKTYGYDIWTVENINLQTQFGNLTLEDRRKFKMGEDQMLEYYSPEKAFPLIKEKIDLTADVNARCELILKMFKCAKHNNDENALLDALKYYSQRHKNDNTSIRQDIFTFLKEQYKMEKFSAEMWKHLTELIRTEEKVSEYAFMMREMLEELLLYKFVNGLDIIADFKKFVKFIGFSGLVLVSKNKELQKWALLKLPEVCAELFTEEEAMKKYPTSFLTVLKYWNLQNPKDVISYYQYPDLIDVAMKNYGESYYDDILPHHIMIYIPTDPKEREKQNELFDHFELFIVYEKLWWWILRHRIDLVEKNIELLFHEKCSYAISNRYFYELNKLHYTAIPAKLRAKALSCLNDEKCDTASVKRALTILSFETDYLQLISAAKYYPTGEGGIDFDEENIRETIQVREHVLDCFRNRVRSEEIIDTLLLFCYKDYFYRALPALTFALYNCPEKALQKPISVLQDRSVTVRKRALFFSTTLGNAQTTCEALKHAGETERNKSLQKFIFNRTFKAFCNICNQVSFDLLMKHFKFVFEKDTETREMVFSISLIPRAYLGTYIEQVWNQIGKKWENEHYHVLNVINADVMPLLSDALCDDIIQYNLVHSNQQLASSDVDFIYNYLVSSGDKIDHRFTLVSNNARVVADEDSQLGFKEFNKKTHNIWFLYSDICNRLITDKETHVGEKKILVNKLKESFPNLPLPYNHLDYQLTVDICKCYLDNETGLPAFFIKLQKHVIDKYGDIMLDYFNEFAREQVHLISDANEYVLNFIQTLLEHDNSTSVKMMAIKLMPLTYPNNENHAIRFRKLLEKIEADAAPAVSLYLNKFLKSLMF